MGDTAGASFSKIIKSLGLVFGDIGTSPIYTVGAILLFIVPTTFNMFGLLSLITWTLFTIITIQYIWLAMSLSDKGEGGTIVLKRILDSLLKPGFAAFTVSVLTIIGIALFIGDGVITPAISILSAVEGILLVPGFEETSPLVLLLIAAVIAISLFLFQRRGTDRIAWVFGPVMAIWFTALAVSGAIMITGAPQVLFALSPTYALDFILETAGPRSLSCLPSYSALPGERRSMRTWAILAGSRLSGAGSWSSRRSCSAISVRARM